MPLYVYRVLESTEPAATDVPAGTMPAPVGSTFEIRQPMSEPALTRHPTTGQPVERVLFAPAISTSSLGNAAINSSGLTKYVKMSDGSYERQAGGGGPKHINPHDYV